MKLLHSLGLLGLSIVSAGTLAMAAGHDTGSAKITSVIFEGTVGMFYDQPMAGYLVGGEISPNSKALLMPIVNDGRLVFAFTDSALAVRSDSSGAFYGELTIPASLQLVQVQLIGADGMLLDSISVSPANASGASR